MSVSRMRKVVGFIVLVGVAVLGMAACGSSSASAVTLEPANNSGADPFSASVAIGRVVSFPGNVAAINATARKTRAVDNKTHTLVATGTAPGLYGGSGDARVCDADQLVAYLGQHADKATAWAGVLGIAPADIKSYVASLTPVVLTTDTIVTNHGYRDGRATTLQSVLQAGTAVLVDNTGTPRVKCNCGNPLTPPEPINVTRGACERHPMGRILVERGHDRSGRHTGEHAHAHRHPQRGILLGADRFERGGLGRGRRHAVRKHDEDPHERRRP